jgi:hypothetical protein
MSDDITSTLLGGAFSKFETTLTPVDHSENRRNHEYWEGRLSSQVPNWDTIPVKEAKMYISDTITSVEDLKVKKKTVEEEGIHQVNAVSQPKLTFFDFHLT